MPQRHNCAYSPELNDASTCIGLVVARVRLDSSCPQETVSQRRCRDRFWARSWVLAALLSGERWTGVHELVCVRLGLPRWFLREDPDAQFLCWRQRPWPYCHQEPGSPDTSLRRAGQPGHMQTSCSAGHNTICNSTSLLRPRTLSLLKRQRPPEAQGGEHRGPGKAEGIQSGPTKTDRATP